MEPPRRPSAAPPRPWSAPDDGVETPARPWIRADGEAKATGQARYTGDLSFPGLAHARLLLAGRAHARIVRLDTARARALPGVLAVLTQDDVPERRYGSFGFVLDRTLFARDVVRFEGEVVAAVAALTPGAGRRGRRRDRGRVRGPPADPRRRGARSSPARRSSTGRRDYAHDPNLDPAGNVAGRSTIVKGDATAALAGAPIVVRERYVADMAHPVPIEPHTRHGRLVRRSGHDLLEHPGAVLRPQQDRRGPRDRRSTGSGSSSPTSAAASAASATSISRGTSPRSRGPPGGRSGSSSAGARSSSPRTR